MFAKPYKLKSNSTLKNSEKKHLAQRIQNGFPAASEEKTKDLIPVKSNTICMKVTCHSGEIIGVYVVDGVPMFLELGDRLLPTMCALWKVPDLIPSLVIHSPVLSKMQAGAPLYLPGVEIPTAGAGFPMFPDGTAVALATTDNAAAAAVGFSMMSSSDMLMKSSGVCFETVHILGDLLCKDTKITKMERPKMGPASYGPHDVTLVLNNLKQLNLSAPAKEEWPSLGPKQSAPPPPPPKVVNEPTLIEDEEMLVEESGDNGADDVTMDESPSIPEDMDGLLQYCLLSFLKLEGKRVELPLKTNLLYRNHLVPLCPDERVLDVKKSSYKKMSKFLDAMQKEGLIEVREVEKGVDAVVGVNTSHPLVRTHAPRPQRVVVPASDGLEYRPPLLRDLYCVTAAVQGLFPGLKKGTALSPTDVRSAVNDYVRSRQLVSANSKTGLTLDDTLAKLTGKQLGATMKWDEVMSLVQGKMTASTEIQFPDGSTKTIKTKLDPITMQVATRSGNKKVTLVSNLESYGFVLSEMSRSCQAGAAASCTVTRSPGAKADQLLLQGDQTYFMAKLLIEKYGMPKKYVEGADKALKKKNR